MIEDVSLDERTKHAFSLTPFFPKFYAGSPIISKTGFILGTFCVFDDEPKKLEHSKLDGLRMLADQFINVYESTINDIDSDCLLYTSPSPRDLSTSRMPSSA